MSEPSIVPRIGSFRWTICALLFLATTINYMDRQIIGVLKPFLASPADGMVLKQDQFQVLKGIIEKGAGLTPEQLALLKPLAGLPTDGIALSGDQVELLRPLIESPAADAGLGAEAAEALKPILATSRDNRYLTQAQFEVLKPLIERSAPTAETAAKAPFTIAQYNALKGLLKKPKAPVFLTKEQYAVLSPVLTTAKATFGLDDKQAGTLAKIADNPQNGIHLGEKEYSYIVIVFQGAYALGLLIFGWFIDRFGTKLSYAGSIVFWSLSSAAHALAGGVLGFMAARFALGVGEAGNFPAANKTTAEWFPKRERALVVSLFNSGTNIGAMLAPPMILWVAFTFGWRAAFLANGILAALWLILWFLFYHKPKESPFVKEAEVTWINQDDSAGEQRTDPVPWSQLFKYRQTWAFCAGKFCTDPIWWFYLFWLPGWLVDAKGVDIKSSVWPLATVYLMATIGSISIAGLSSKLIARGVTANKARKTALGLCALLVLPIVLAVNASNLWVAVALVGLAAAAHQGWSANIFCTVSDMFPKRAVGSVTGIGGMAGSVGSMIFAYVIGQVLDAGGSYWIPFIVSASAYSFALVFFHLLVPRMEPVKLD